MSLQILEKNGFKNSSFLIKKLYGFYGFWPNLVQGHFGDQKPTINPEKQTVNLKRQIINQEKADHKPTKGRQ